MVVGTETKSTLADVIFAIEGTASNGAYLNDMKTNYLIPALEYFSQGCLSDDEDLFEESSDILYGIVVYHAADRLPGPCTEIHGPYSNAHRLLEMIDRLQLVGGRGESHANVAEALATSLVCFEDLQLKRDPNANPQKHCILICNSPPYLMPVAENLIYAGSTAEQLASIFNERNINLTILSARKIPAMFKLYEKAGGDLSSVQTKNYARDPRHLVLLKGFSLKERPVSPPHPAVTGAAPTGVGVNAGPRYPVYSQSAAQPRPPAPPRWPVTTPRPPPSFTQPTSTASALIEQLTRPPSIVQPFSNSGVPMSHQQQWGQGPISGGQAGQNNMGVPVSVQGTMGPPLSGQSPMVISMANQGPMGPPLGAQGSMGSSLGNQGPDNMGGGLVGQSNLGNSLSASCAMTGAMSSVPSSMGGPLPTQNTMSAVPSASYMSQGYMGSPNHGMLDPSGMMGSGQQMSSGVMSQQNPAFQQTLGNLTGPPAQQPLVPMRVVVWRGTVQWFERTKHGVETLRTARQSPCQIMSTQTDGEPEIKAEGWPPVLVMQLVPKTLLGNIGGPYLKDCKSVTFHFQQSESLDVLTKSLTTGYAGCIHFQLPQSTSVSVILLLYTAEKQTFYGFIPNDQSAFIIRLRKIIAQHKLMKDQHAAANAASLAGASGMLGPSNMQMGGGGLAAGMQAGGYRVGGMNQQGGGLQLGMSANMGQQGPCRMQTPQGASQMQNMLGGVQGMQAAMQPGLQAGPAGMQGGIQAMQPNQNAQNDQQFHDAAREEKMRRLQYALEASQDFQFKQMEYMNQMSMQQLSDPNQMASQQMDDQEKMRLQFPLRGNQQRMVRPSMPNNPGLKHLLQQGPYRMQGNHQLRSALPQQPTQQQQMQQQFGDVSYDFPS